MTGKYDDILYMQRPVSEKHKPMSMLARAAQFAPFAALNGYDDAIAEEAAETEAEIDMGDEQKEQIGHIVLKLHQRIGAGEKPVMRITYFVKDAVKNGGKYKTEEKELVKIKLERKRLIFGDGTSVSLNQIKEIEELE